MNASIDHELAAIVDAAVRPLWATPRRKQMIREELLAHVTSVFEEELAHLDDEQAALDAARRRFGAPSDLQPQLQAAVSMLGGRFLLSEKELPMARWLATGIIAFAFGMGILLPACAAIKQQGVYHVLPLIAGGLITLTGIVAFGYGIVQKMTRAS